MARKLKSGFLPCVEELEERALLSFAAPLSLPAGASLTSVVAADLNGDGKLDMVGVVAGTNTVGVMLGKGDGTFQPAVAYNAGTGPQALAVGDFLHNGKLDLAVANNGGVSILLGTGDGTFQKTFFNYAAGANPDFVAVGDFNGDGKLDLVVANRYAGTINVLMGKGDGTFRAPVSYAAGQVPVSIAVGDFNGDGKQDLAVADYNGGGPGQLSILMNNGNGTFRAPVSYTTSAQGALSVVAGDFNGDQKTDLAVMNNDFTVSTFTGNGDGTFHLGGTVAALGRDALVAGDFNNDHNLDLATVDNATGQVSVLSGNGDGTFQPAALYPTGGPARGLAAGDFNGDHLPDLVTGASILVDIPRATLLNVSVTPVGPVIAGTPASLTITAEDNFGNIATGYTGTIQLTSSDIGAALPNSYTFTSADHGTHTFTSSLLFFNAGPETLTATDAAATIHGTAAVQVNAGAVLPSTTYAPAAPVLVGQQPVLLAVGDLNGDGKLDVVSANFGGFGALGSGSVSVLLGKGDGTFQAVPGAVNVGRASPIAIALGDFNGDGKLDLACADVLGGTLTIFLGNGDGTFHVGNTFSVGTLPLALAVADVNGDHKLDLVVTSAGAQPQSAGQVAIYLGNGDGTFQLGQSIPVGALPSAVAAGDLNGDGKVDVVLTSAATGTVNVLLGNGTFQAPVSLAVGTGPIAVKLVDLNADGKLDLVTVNSKSSTLSVLLGNGDGTFQLAVNYPVSEDPEALAVADLNGDGKLDLVVTSNYDQPTGSVSVLLGNGNGTFQAPVNYDVGPGPVPVIVADLNGDGTPDLIVGNTGHSQAPGASLSVLLNPGASQLQLSATTYNVQENAGSVTITVTRTGDTSGTVSVQYATSDGLAAAGVDYTAASGTLTFTPGDTSETFTVPLLDDGQIEGTETVNLALSSPTAGATLVGEAAQAVMVIRDNNDGTANQRFVAQIYQELLHRPVDAGGLAYWARTLDRGMSRSQVVQALEKSPEFFAQEVQQIFVTYLGRLPDQSGLNSFVSLLTRGGTVEQITGYVVGSAEYFTRAGGTAATFLTTLYRDLLGRDPDGGAAIWLARLNAGWSRTTVTMSVAGSSEGTHYHVQGLYRHYLRRAADPSGLNAFAWELAHGFRDEQIIGALVGSGEYGGNL